jgi:sec-independent protein translocase protein TatC
VTTPPPPDSPYVQTAGLLRDDVEEEPEEHDRSRMSFLEHLDELRKRIIYSIYALVGGCVVSFTFLDRIVTFVTAPIKVAVSGPGNPLGGRMLISEPSEGFMFNLKIGLLGGIIAAAPFMFMQLWYFVAPGLYAREKKIVIPFVISASALFIAGAWFAHAYAFPITWKFFSTFGNNDMMVYLPTVSSTFSLYVKMVLGLGIIFQMPILAFFLARMGIVSARFMLEKGKYAILIIFIIAGVASPGTDMMSQFVFAAPMLMLYLVSIVVVWIFAKKRKKDESEDL